MAASAGDSAEPRATDTVVGIIIILASLLFRPTSRQCLSWKALAELVDGACLPRDNRCAQLLVCGSPKSGFAASGLGSSWGKLFYGVVASVIVTVSKVGQIRTSDC